MKKGNNKGAAMVTVLIAITFVSILVSSMLYASYVNFLTKSTRVRSADNFYTDEFALDEIAAGIQQAAASANDVDQAHEYVRTLAGVSGATGDYDATKLQDLIRIASQDSSITVTNCGVSGSSYSENGSEIKFNRVHLESVKADGFTNSIDTDIVINIPRGKTSSVDVNSFSVICDDQIYNAAPKAGNAIFCGNFYVSSKQTNNVALSVGEGRFYQIMGQYGVIDGDLEITGRSAVYISGEFIVNGKVDIKNDSTLLVGGHLYCRDIETDSSSSYQAVDSHNLGPTVNQSRITIGIPAEYTIPDHSTENRLAEDLLAQHLWLYDGLNLFDVGGQLDAHGNKKNILEYLLGGAGSTAYNWPGEASITNCQVGYKMYQSENSTVEVCSNSENAYYTAMMGAPGSTGSRTINSIYAYLGFIHESIEMTQQAPESTIICLGGIKFSQCHSMNISHMSDRGYQACINTLIKYRFNNTAPNSLANNTLGGYANQGDDVNTALSLSTIDKVYKYSDVDSDVSTKVLAQAKPSSLDVRSSERYVLYDSTTKINYVPYGYLLSSDTPSIIAKHFPMIAPSSTSVNPVVSFRHWTKE